MKNYNWLFFLLIISGLISFSACRSTNYLSSVAQERLTVGKEESLKEDAAIAAMIQPYKIELDKNMNQVIGATLVNLTKKRPEGTLGNWMADAIHRKAETVLGKPIDFAIQNYGGIRINEIPKGEITKGKIFEVMPFDNTIMVLSLNKMEVEELVDHIAKAGGWPVSYTAKIEKTDQELSILIRNKPLEEGKIYLVALPDYIANGGSRSYFLKDKPRQDLALFIRDALLEDVANFSKMDKAIDSKIEGRFSIKMED